MPTPPVPEETVRARIAAYREAVAAGHTPIGEPVRAGQVSALRVASQKCKVDANQIRKAVEASGPKDAPAPILPAFPDDDLPAGELIEMMCKRFGKRSEAKQARLWFPIKIRENKPIGILWFGDPHVDDNGCNWPLLKRHTEIAASTEGLYGANIGDSTNNWVGRLTRLFANQDTSQDTARKLAKWLLTESGVKWLLWLIGNHDAWNDGATILRLMNRDNRIPIEDWGAQFRLVFPNGFERRVWAAHNFSGHSMWNTLHGPQKAAHTKSHAHLYVCGHTHNWALHHEESASRDFTYWLARTRGYKYIDSHAEHMGHASQDEGAAILSIFNPLASTEAGSVLCFADVEQGADYLTWLRKR